MQPTSLRPCLPSPAAHPPAGPDWPHEIRHDRYRLLAQRDGERVRLFTRNGYDWSDRFALIVAAVGALSARTCTIDGEALNRVAEEPGDVVYKHPCVIGCEGIVSKRRSSRYVSGRSEHWRNVKNPTAPAVKREREEEWGKCRRKRTP
jgi:ATP-dependent DNA ligase